MKTFVEKLSAASKATGSVACVGMDPLEKIFAVTASQKRDPSDYAEAVELWRRQDAKSRRAQ